MMSGERPGTRTTAPYEHWPTGSSASSMAVFGTDVYTTKTPHEAIVSKKLLDKLPRGMSRRPARTSCSTCPKPSPRAAS